MSSKKSEAGQSQLLLSLFIILLTSVAVIATNSTLNASFIQSYETQNIEKSALIEVWADTSIHLEINQNFVDALLLLDNGTALPGQEINFYLNESLLYSKTTDSEGRTKIYLNLTPGVYVLKAAFPGNNSLYLNPSETVERVEIKIEEKVPTIPLTQTLTVNTDKKNYVANETIRIFGEVEINGVKANKKIDLTIEKNKSLVYSTQLNVINGTYSHSLIANFEESGTYELNVYVDSFRNFTTFYYYNGALNLTYSLPQISDERVNATQVKQNEIVRLSAKVSGTNEIKNVTFLIVDPKMNFFEVLATKGTNNEYYYDLKTEKVGTYKWHRVYAYDIFEVGNLSMPEITISVEKILPLLEISNVSIEGINNTFKVKAILTSKLIDSKNLIATLSGPEEIEIENYSIFISEIGKDESFELSWLVKTKMCGDFNLRISVSNEISTEKGFWLNTSCENIDVEIETIQGRVEIGKPVKWKKIVKIRNPTNSKLINQKVKVLIHELAEKIDVKNSNKKPKYKILAGSKVVELEIDEINEIYNRIRDSTPYQRRNFGVTSNSKKRL
jgi:hypothetical protein